MLHPVSDLTTAEAVPATAAERVILPMGRCHENAANFVSLVIPRDGSR